MASTTYYQEVIFIHRRKKNVQRIKLQKQAGRVWTPLLISEVKTRTIFLHMFLSNGTERMNPITLTVPLCSDLSCDVTDYSCEALFQDGKDEKERISLMKKNSEVEEFSVDVEHTPPSIYTVTDLISSDPNDEPHTQPGLSGDTKLAKEASAVEDGLRKLILSPEPNTSCKRRKKPLPPKTAKGLKKAPPCSCLVFLKDTETNGISLLSTTNSEITFPFQLRPVTDYDLVVFRGVETHQCRFRVQAVAQCSFRSYMTQMEVDELHRRALEHTLCQGLLQCHEFIPIEHLYRNKPLHHFKNIYDNMNGIMHKYIKNFGGDPASTLNRKLHGLFFSASVDTTTGLPKPVSFYGDQRIHIPVHLMITPNTNLYFADFYCHYVKHRVTLVVTLKGSEADEFCRKRLVTLNQSENKFLYRQPDVQFAMVNTRVTVEVFYTESIDIVNLLKSRTAFQTTVEQKGNAELKTIIGIPKRKDCKICNLK